MRTSTSRRRALPLIAPWSRRRRRRRLRPGHSLGRCDARRRGAARRRRPAAGRASAPPPTRRDPRTAPPSSGAGASASGHGVRLEATFEIGFPEQPSDPGVRKKPGVVVTYTLTREGGAAGELVAYDVVPDTLGSAGLPPDVNPEHAWVYADGETVRISKQAFATAPASPSSPPRRLVRASSRPTARCRAGRMPCRPPSSTCRVRSSPRPVTHCRRARARGSSACRSASVCPGCARRLSAGRARGPGARARG